MNSVYFECCDCSCVYPGDTAQLPPAICESCENPPQYGWRPWPEEDVLAFVNLAISKKHDDARIRSVLLATALETLLEDTLLTVLHWSYVSVPIAELLLDSYRGFERRTRLYYELVGFSINDSLKMSGYQQFYNGWQSIVVARNTFVHGRLAPNNKTSDHNSVPPDEVLNNVETNMLGAFARIRHIAKERVDPKPSKRRLFAFDEIHP